MLGVISLMIGIFMRGWHVVVLLAGCLRANALSPAVVRIERASRELTASFIYESLVSGREPLELFDDEGHQEFWFSRGSKSVAAELQDAAKDGFVAEAKPIAPPEKPEKFNSPLLAARAERARKTVQLPLPTLQSKLPENVPADAIPEGDAIAADDTRSGASRALVRAKLIDLQERRPRLERAINDQLDPLAAPNLPAFDIAVLLLFLSELESALPVPVACKEAVALSVAYSGDEQQSYRHVQGILGAYAREQLGYTADGLN